LTAAGAPTAGPGANQSLLGTTTRKDGTTEVAYNGHPLYYFVSDKQPGDVTGQALSSFGADWYVLSAAGTKIDKG
jgi:predicted lipoprotein with Yx(FWY)xxD motif